MRRLLVTVAALAALLAAGGCSGERDPVAGSTSSPGTGPSGGVPSSGAPAPDGTAGPGGSPGVDTTPAGGNGKEVCAAAVKASTTSVQTFVAELGKSLQATAANDTAGARAAQQKAEAALRSWSTTMREQAVLATDARLKAVLAEIATEVGRMKASVDSVDETKLEQLQQRLDQLCGS